MRKWTYNNCDVEITAVRKPVGAKFVPFVAITSPGAEGKTLIMPSNLFDTSEMAEDHGQDRAREWIDKHVK